VVVVGGGGIATDKIRRNETFSVNYPRRTVILISYRTDKRCQTW
jgi:hypothetical protein